MKRKPIAFVAICQCGVTVGAMDFERTDRKEAGQILALWLMDGCTIEPRFDIPWLWIATIEPCKCDKVAGEVQE